MIKNRAKLFIIGIILSLTCQKAVFANKPTIPRDMLLRLLSSTVVPMGEVKLNVDRLTSNLPVEIPILDRANIAASVSYGEKSFYVFLDIPDSAENIQTSYEDILIGEGWEQIPINKDDNSYKVALSYPIAIDHTQSTIFCNKDENTTLVLSAPPSQDSIAKVILRLDSVLYAPCREESETSNFSVTPIPVLNLPPQTQGRTIGSGGGVGDYTINGIISTELDRDILFDRYYSQMEAQGWSKIIAAEKDLFSTSFWQFQDSDNKDWIASFYWRRLAENSNNYVLEFRVANKEKFARSFATAIQKIPLNSNEKISEELAWRILLGNLPETRQRKGQFLVKKLPSDLPLDIPLPDNTEIIGSINGENYKTILLTIPQSPEEVSKFYLDELSAISWEENDGMFDHYDRVGFIASGYKPIETTIFCNKDLGWELYYNTRPSVRSNYTDMQLRIYKSYPASVCNSSGDFKKRIEDNKNKDRTLFKQISVPILNPPEQTQVLFLNPSGATPSLTYSSHEGDDDLLSLRYSSNAAIQTQLSLEEIANYYFSQMPKYGWTKVSEVKQDSIAVSVWTFQNDRGQNFQATLDIVRDRNIGDSYSANLRIFLVQNPQQTAFTAY